MKTAIVTGGTGFIGSHLVEELLKEGYKIFVIDNFSTGDTRRLIELPVHIHKFDISNGSFAKNELINILSQDVQVDYFFHLAAKASIVPSIKDPVSYHDTNVSGTLNMLELARAIGVKKFIYAASGSCYGLPEELPTSENCPIRPEYPYALTKNLGEQYVSMWGKLYGLPYVSLRLFNVFGPRMCLSGGYGGLFSTILPQKFNNQPVITIGNGEQRRDFVYVTDVARAFIMAAESSVENEIFNVGMGASFSVNEILKLLDIYREEGNVKRLPNRPGEPFETRANITKIIIRLGWRPEIKFSDGLTSMINDVNYWKSARVWTWEESLKVQEDWYRLLGHKIK